jgi:hypothetical protein
MTDARVRESEYDRILYCDGKCISGSMQPRDELKQIKMGSNGSDLVFLRRLLIY